MRKTITYNGVGDERFFTLLCQAWQLHQDKGSDYASFKEGDFLANLREVEHMDIDAFTGVLVRMSDKWSRIRSLFKKSKRGEGAAVKDESMIDTLKDMAAYSYLAIILLQEQQNKQLATSVKQVIEKDKEDALRQEEKEQSTFVASIYRYTSDKEECWSCDKKLPANTRVVIDGTGRRVREAEENEWADGFIIDKYGEK